MLAGEELKLIGSEGNLFKSLMRWIEHDKENRLQYLDYFLSEIRFPIIEGEVLATVDSHPLLVSKRDIISPKLYEAMIYNLNPAMIENKEDKKFLKRDCDLFNFIPNGMPIKFTNLITGKHVTVIMNGSNDKGEVTKKKRRNQVKSPCDQCRKAHMFCTDEKPCPRCVKLGFQCVCGKSLQ